MVGKIAGAVARAVARAEAERPSLDDRAKSPGLMGARRYHAVRLWNSVQPHPAQQAPEGMLLLARGLGLRALYAAVQLAHPVALAGVLGTAGARAVADLLRRHPGRGDQAGLCRGTFARAAQKPPPHRARPRGRYATSRVARRMC